MEVFKHRNIIIILMFSALISGCSIVNDSIRQSYQEKKTLEKGTTVTNVRGLYSLTVPVSEYYYEEDSSGIILIPKDALAEDRGNYLVRTFPVDMLPKNAAKDLNESFKWIAKKIITPKTKCEPEIIQSHDRDFGGEKALYLETFIKGKITGHERGVVIERPSFGYVNLIFYHKGYLYWIYYSEPDSNIKTYSIPQVQDRTRNGFENFVEKISIDPRNK